MMGLQVIFFKTACLALSVFLIDKACYDARTEGQIGYVKTDPSAVVSKSHCDKLEFVTLKELGFMQTLCQEDCSCCRPAEYRGKKLVQFN